MPQGTCGEHLAHGSMLKSHEKKLDDHDDELDKVESEQSEMRVVMQRITDLCEFSQKLIAQHDSAIARHEERIHALEDKPANDAKRIKDAALASVGGAIGTGLIATFAVAISKTIS